MVDTGWRGGRQQGLIDVPVLSFDWKAPSGAFFFGASIVPLLIGGRSAVSTVQTDGWSAMKVGFERDPDRPLMSCLARGTKTFRMDFFARQGVRRRHGRAMVTTNNTRSQRKTPE